MQEKNSYGFIRQKTIRETIKCSGVALHSGATVDMYLKPAPENSGIVFVRTDVKENNIIPAHWDNVVDTRLCTKIGNESGCTVGTVEHLMSAIAGCEVDNLIIELDQGEVPVMDGSSDCYVALFDQTDIIEQNAPRRYIQILEKKFVRHNGAFASLSPHTSFKVDVEINFDTKAIGSQRYQYIHSRENFSNNIAKARTFGFLHEAEFLWKQGLAKGASLENTIVIDSEKVMNDDGLRFKDEFVRHKVLDSIGDLYLAGAPIIGAFRGSKNGHCINNLMLKELLSDTKAWRYIYLPVQDTASNEEENKILPFEPAAASKKPFRSSEPVLV